ncbi:MAG TPA: iron chelate uptake ABC transporter family permease subunit [Syntrophales bacterium]|nr:iron chelate uptake ABC transporter family permease subunit [Syntrophales bacterium]HOX93767.1 iron chelate uptake ABC transporter family permease subunit [Syntrophales bacterium]HPI57716.1 iron chelate uptake ABC transporter family permease subunit [Syntrophales bacterium]HPN23949.1 iron chelate uptake ABC transporter family permease subunit [Syntrophales bacterium]HQM28227.1 iron chelate uptake ABC transporter family permease subunit [Syntrophales bacterium]
MVFRTVNLLKILEISILLMAVLAGSIVVSLFVGVTDIGIIRGITGLLDGWREGHTGLTQLEREIIFSIRLPRILFASIVGASLSMAGAVFQALLRNPLADPYILGISGGAAVGAIIGILIGAAALPLGIPGLAFLGAVLTVITVFGIARTGTQLRSNTLLLAGVIVNAFFSAIIMFLISTSTSSDIHNVMFWLMGDLSLATTGEIALTGTILLGGFAVLYAHARPMNLIVVSEETALQLGINVEKAKKILFVAASLITGVAVSVSGIIGFVGLVIPHLMRMVFGPDHRMLLPASFLFGASFLVVADTIARTLMAPGELPVGVITAICGAPYFIYLLRRGRGY